MQASCCIVISFLSSAGERRGAQHVVGSPCAVCGGGGAEEGVQVLLQSSHPRQESLTRFMERERSSPMKRTWGGEKGGPENQHFYTSFWENPLFCCCLSYGAVDFIGKLINRLKKTLYVVKMVNPHFKVN